MRRRGWARGGGRGGDDAAGEHSKVPAIILASHRVAGAGPGALAVHPRAAAAVFDARHRRVDNVVLHVRVVHVLHPVGERAAPEGLPVVTN